MNKNLMAFIGIIGGGLFVFYEALTLGALFVLGSLLLILSLKKDSIRLPKTILKTSKLILCLVLFINIGYTLWGYTSALCLKCMKGIHIQNVLISNIGLEQDLFSFARAVYRLYPRASTFCLMMTLLAMIYGLQMLYLKKRKGKKNV